MRLLLALAISAALGVGLYFAVADRGTSRPPTACRTADPAAEGVDAVKLEAAVRRIQEEDGGVLALLVARHGRLVLERYFHGYDRHYPFDVYSITKSVTSALAGMVLADRLDARLPELFAERVPAAARAITLRQLPRSPMRPGSRRGASRRGGCSARSGSAWRTTDRRTTRASRTAAPASRSRRATPRSSASSISTAGAGTGGSSFRATGSRIRHAATSRSAAARATATSGGRRTGAVSTRSRRSGSAARWSPSSRSWT
jgi:Beta-lactamase